MILKGETLWEFRFSKEAGLVIKEPIAWLRRLPVSGCWSALFGFAVAIPVFAIVLVVAVVAATVCTPVLLASLGFRALVLGQRWSVPE